MPTTATNQPYVVTGSSGSRAQTLLRRLARFAAFTLLALFASALNAVESGLREYTCTLLVPISGDTRARNIAVLGFSYRAGRGVEPKEWIGGEPFDTLAAPKAQFTVRKALDQASPALMRAAADSIRPSGDVELKCNARTASAAFRSFEIDLEGATVASVTSRTERWDDREGALATNPRRSKHQHEIREYVAFEYRSIEWTFNATKGRTSVVNQRP